MISRKAEGILLWLFAIVIFALVILFIVFLVGAAQFERGNLELLHCPGECKLICDVEEEHVDSQTCTFSKPVCCMAISGG